MELLSSDHTQQLQSILSDPFKKDKWTEVYFTIWNVGHMFNKKIAYSAIVKFQSGNTKGEQKFEGEDFEEVVRKVQQFMITLP